MVAQPDELVDFHHLRARRGLSQLEIEDQARMKSSSEEYCVLGVKLGGLEIEFRSLCQNVRATGSSVSAQFLLMMNETCVCVITDLDRNLAFRSADLNFHFLQLETFFDWRRHRWRRTCSGRQAPLTQTPAMPTG